MGHCHCAVGALTLTAILFSTAAAAQDSYISVSGGVAFLQDSDNSGAFSRAFTTGAGTTIPAGTVLPAGTPLGWTTEFEEGYSISGAYGVRFGDSFRGEVELSYQSNDIDTHNGVTAAGIPLASEDAGVLITGSGNLGITVGALVDDGQGSVSTTYLMANAYYDFPAFGAVQPYVGAGIGLGFVDVDYSPSNVSIIDDEATVFAYQAMVGASVAVSDSTAVFAQYRYRATSDVETEASLFAANLDIENGSSLVEAGVRFGF
jgi:opacity protein-like surface antigen